MKGKGGNRYDVVPTVWCLENMEQETVENALENEMPDFAHNVINYKQDGNATFATNAADYDDF